MRIQKNMKEELRQCAGCRPQGRGEVAGGQHPRLPRRPQGRSRFHRQRAVRRWCRCRVRVRCWRGHRRFAPSARSAAPGPARRKAQWKRRRAEPVGNHLGWACSLGCGEKSGRVVQPQRPTAGGLRPFLPWATRNNRNRLSRERFCLPMRRCRRVQRQQPPQRQWQRPPRTRVVAYGILSGTWRHAGSYCLRELGLQRQHPRGGCSLQ